MGQRLQVGLEQIGDAAHGHIRSGMRRGDGRVVGELALHWQHSGDAVGPLSLHGAEDPDLVVDEDVARGRVASLDVLELVFLVDVDEDAVRDVANAGSSDLAGLEDRITVSEDDHRPGSPQALENLERGRQAVPMQVNPATETLYIVNPFSGGGMTALFSTHPPLEERVARLREYDRNRGLA